MSQSQQSDNTNIDLLDDLKKQIQMQEIVSNEEHEKPQQNLNKEENQDENILKKYQSLQKEYDKLKEIISKEKQQVLPQKTDNLKQLVSQCEEEFYKILTINVHFYGMEDFLNQPLKYKIISTEELQKNLKAQQKKNQVTTKEKNNNKFNKYFNKFWTDYYQKMLESQGISQDVQVKILYELQNIINLKILDIEDHHLYDNNYKQKLVSDRRIFWLANYEIIIYDLFIMVGKCKNRVSKKEILTEFNIITNDLNTDINSNDINMNQFYEIITQQKSRIDVIHIWERQFRNFPLFFQQKIRKHRFNGARFRYTSSQIHFDEQAKQIYQYDNKKFYNQSIIGAFLKGFMMLIDIYDQVTDIITFLLFRRLAATEEENTGYMIFCILLLITEISPYIIAQSSWVQFYSKNGKFDSKNCCQKLKYFTFMTPLGFFYVILLQIFEVCSIIFEALLNIICISKESFQNKMEWLEKLPNQWFGMTQNDFNGYKTQKRITQLMYESIPIAIMNGLFLFFYKELNIEKVKENDAILIQSLISAFLKLVKEILIIQQESKHLQETSIQYGLQMMRARQNWIPFIALIGQFNSKKKEEKYKILASDEYEKRGSIHLKEDYLQQQNDMKEIDFSHICIPNLLGSKTFGLYTFIEYQFTNQSLDILINKINSLPDKVDDNEQTKYEDNSESSQLLKNGEEEQKKLMDNLQVLNLKSSLKFVGLNSIIKFFNAVQQKNHIIYFNLQQIDLKIYILDDVINKQAQQEQEVYKKYLLNNLTDDEKKEILQKESSIENLLPWGDTIIMWALKNRNVLDTEIVDLILRKYNIEQNDDSGETPLIYVLKQLDFEFFKDLIDKGANINHMNNDNESVLSYLFTDQRIENDKYSQFTDFLKEKYKIDDQDNIDKTLDLSVLHQKNIKGSYIIFDEIDYLFKNQTISYTLKLLLKLQTKFDIYDSNGQTPFSYLLQFTIIKSNDNDYFDNHIWLIEQLQQKCDNDNLKKEITILDPKFGEPPLNNILNNINDESRKLFKIIIEISFDSIFTENKKKQNFLFSIFKNIERVQKVASSSYICAVFSNEKFKYDQKLEYLESWQPKDETKKKIDEQTNLKGFLIQCTIDSLFGQKNLEYVLEVLKFKIDKLKELESDGKSFLIFLIKVLKKWNEKDQTYENRKLLQNWILVIFNYYFQKDCQDYNQLQPELIKITDKQGFNIIDYLQASDNLDLLDILPQKIKETSILNENQINEVIEKSKLGQDKICYSIFVQNKTKPLSPLLFKTVSKIQGFNHEDYEKRFESVIKENQKIERQQSQKLTLNKLSSYLGKEKKVKNFKAQPSHRFNLHSFMELIQEIIQLFDLLSDLYILFKLVNSQHPWWGSILSLCILSPYFMMYPALLTFFLEKNIFTNDIFGQVKASFYISFLSIFFIFLLDVFSTVVNLVAMIFGLLCCRQSDDVLEYIFRYAGFSNMDIKGIRKLRSVAQLLFESMPQILLQFRIYQSKETRDQFDIDEYAVLGSLLSAIFHLIIESMIMYQESCAYRQNFNSYLAVCLRGRLGWIPYISSIQNTNEVMQQKNQQIEAQDSVSITQVKPQGEEKEKSQQLVKKQKSDLDLKDVFKVFDFDDIHMDSKCLPKTRLEFQFSNVTMQILTETINNFPVQENNEQNNQEQKDEQQTVQQSEQNQSDIITISLGSSINRITFKYFYEFLILAIDRIQIDISSVDILQIIQNDKSNKKKAIVEKQVQQKEQEINDEEKQQQQQIINLNKQQQSIGKDYILEKLPNIQLIVKKLEDKKQMISALNLNLSVLISLFTQNQILYIKYNEVDYIEVFFQQQFQEEFKEYKKKKASYYLDVDYQLLEEMNQVHLNKFAPFKLYFKQNDLEQYKNIQKQIEKQFSKHKENIKNFEILFDYDYKFLLGICSKIIVNNIFHNNPKKIDQLKQEIIEKKSLTNNDNSFEEQDNSNNLINNKYMELSEFETQLYQHVFYKYNNNEKSYEKQINNQIYNKDEIKKQQNLLQQFMYLFATNGQILIRKRERKMEQQQLDKFKKKDDYINIKRFFEEIHNYSTNYYCPRQDHKLSNCLIHIKQCFQCKKSISYGNRCRKQCVECSEDYCRSCYPGTGISTIYGIECDKKHIIESIEFYANNCDNCSKHLEGGVKGYRCTTCDIDICSSCKTNRIESSEYNQEEEFSYE